MTAREERARWQEYADCPNLSSCLPLSSSSKPESEDRHDDTGNGSDHPSPDCMHQNCCPNISSCLSSSKSESESRHGEAANMSDHPLLDCMCQNCSPNLSEDRHGDAANGLDQPLPNGSDLPPDTNWWLYLQSNFRHQKSSKHEHLTTMNTEGDTIVSYDFIDHTAIEVLTTQTDIESNGGSFLDQPGKFFSTYMKKEQSSRISELKTGLYDNPQKVDEDRDMGESWCGDEDLDPAKSLGSEQSKELSSDLDRYHDAADGSDHPPPDCMHQNCYLLNDLPPDTKGWLYLQSNFEHQKDFEYEQLTTMDGEGDILSYEIIDRTDAAEGLTTQIDTKNNSGSFLNHPEKVSSTCMKEDQFTRMSELKGLHNNNPQKEVKDKDTGEFRDEDEDLDPANSLGSEQTKKISSDLECHWKGAEITKPWWHKADKDMLTSWIAQKSFELKTGLSNNPQKVGKDKDLEFWYEDADLDPAYSLAPEESKKLSSDLESHRMGAEKTVPWWHKSNKDMLASLVAQKSFEHIENCDLPRPRTKHFGEDLASSLECLDQDWVVSPYLEQVPELGFSNLTNYTRESPTSGSMDGKQCDLDTKKGSMDGSNDTLFRNNDQIMTDRDQEETFHILEDATKAQLLEALCHSQTRAREAEKAAQDAYNEKEHIIKLFFKQASQLFTYKQWLQLLQLETLRLELKNNKQPISTISPTFLPQAIPYKDEKPRKVQHRAAKKKKQQQESLTNEVSRYAVAFAVGLGLVGAGLLLGHTMGWLFPAD